MSAQNPYAFLVEVLDAALADAGFTARPWAPDPIPAAGTYWRRLSRAVATEEDAGGVPHVWRQDFLVLAGVAAQQGDALALDAALHDGLMQLRYCVEAYDFGGIPEEEFEAFETTIKTGGAATTEWDMSPDYEAGSGVVLLTGWIEYSE